MRKANLSQEKILERKLGEKVEAAGGWSLKLWPVSVAGLPDRMVLLPGGRIRFVEMKSEGKKPTAIQLMIHARFYKLGFQVTIISNEQQLNAFIHAIQTA